MVPEQRAVEYLGEPSTRKPDEFDSKINLVAKARNSSLTKHCLAIYFNDYSKYAWIPVLCDAVVVGNYFLCERGNPRVKLQETSPSITYRINGQFCMPTYSYIMSSCWKISNKARSITTSVTESVIQSLSLMLSAWAMGNNYVITIKSTVKQEICIQTRSMAFQRFKVWYLTNCTDLPHQAYLSQTEPRHTRALCINSQLIHNKDGTCMLSKYVCNENTGWDGDHNVPCKKNCQDMQFQCLSGK